MDVWLVTLVRSFGKSIWEDARNLKLISVLNGRLGEKRVSSLVEFFYVNELYSLPDMVRLAQNKPMDRYKAVKTNQGIICGHNPFVFARKVEVVEVRIEGDVEKLLWREKGVVKALKR